MTKIKTLTATAILVAAAAAPAFAQNAGVLQSRYGYAPGYSTYYEQTGGMHQPGDYAETDGGSGRSRNPTGQVEPGTSNSPAGNAAGE